MNGGVSATNHAGNGAIIMTCVLITSAIRPADQIKYLLLTDINSRLYATKASILFIISQGVKDVVVVDSTGHNIFSQNEILDFANHGVNIEQFSYLEDADLVRSRGKGFGEARILEFAHENSRLLQENEGFFKLTGKYFCLNFSEINRIISENNLQNIFWRWAENTAILFRNCVDTRFFYVNRNFLKESLLPAFLETHDSLCIEEQAYLVVSKSLRAGTTMLPKIAGLSGGTAKVVAPYVLGDLERNFPCWVG